MPGGSGGAGNGSTEDLEIGRTGGNGNGATISGSSSSNENGIGGFLDKGGYKGIGSHSGHLSLNQAHGNDGGKYYGGMTQAFGAGGGAGYYGGGSGGLKSDGVRGG